MAEKFRATYLPTALAHYFVQGNIKPINDMVVAIDNAKGLGRFKATLKMISAHVWDNEKGRFVRNPDRKKYDAKVARMTKLNDDGVPQWAVILGKHLEREIVDSKKAESLSFGDKAMAKLQAIVNMAEKAESDEDKAIFAPFLDSVSNQLEEMRAAKTNTPTPQAF